MPPVVSVRALVLALLLVACGDGGEPLAPPLPENLASFDARVVERIEGARARVLAEPTSGVRWAELGMVFGSERLKSLAVTCYREAERLEPRQPKWPYREAITLAQLGDMAGARVAMGRSLAIEDEYAPSHARLGNYALELGELDVAEASFREATRLDSSYPGGWVGLARVALQHDRTAEAIELARRLVEKDPADRTFTQLLTLARRQAGEALEAEPDSALASEDVPVWNDPWELEARSFRESPVMLRIGRLVEARQWPEALALIDGERLKGATREDTALNRAAALEGLGRSEEALVELDALLALEADNTSALLQKARILDDAERVPEALALLERVTALQPSHAGAFAALGGKLHALGAHEPAAKALEQAVRLGESDYDLRFRLGSSWIVLKRWEEARTLFRTLTAERPADGDAWLQLAVCELRTGDLAAAEQAHRRGVATPGASARLARDVGAALDAARERRARKEAGASEGGTEQ